MKYGSRSRDTKTMNGALEQWILGLEDGRSVGVGDPESQVVV